MKREQSSRRRGIVLWYSIIMMMAMCLFLSLAVDYGRTQLVKTELMRAADSAARAAAASVPADFDAATTSAIQIAAMNNADGTPVNIASSEIVFGSWDASLKTFTPLTGSALSQANAVQVTASRSVGAGGSTPLILAGIYGVKSCNVQATAIAMTKNGPSSYGIVGLNWVTMSGNAHTDSYQSANGAYSASDAQNHGSVASNGNITMSGNASIHGDAAPGAGHSVSGGTVTGSITPATTPLNYPAADAGTAATINNDATVSGYMKSGSFNISGNKTAIFHAGSYYFNDFTASGGSVINANVDGPVTIYVAGNFTLSGGSSAYQGMAQNLRVVLLNSGTKATLSGNSAIYVDLYAPLSDVTISGTGDLYGQMIGKTMTLPGDAAIHYDENMAGAGSKRQIVSVR